MLSELEDLLLFLYHYDIKDRNRTLYVALLTESRSLIVAIRRYLEAHKIVANPVQIAAVVKKVQEVVEDKPESDL